MTNEDAIITCLSNYISNKRLDHSIRVSETAQALAIHYNVEPGPVKYAGLLHDIAKELNPSKCNDKHIYVQAFDRCWAEFPSVWHSFVGPLIVDYEFDDQFKHSYPMMDIHTTGNKDMTTEQMIVFIADFIEPGREQTEFRQQLRDDCNTNLKKAVAKIVRFNIQKLIDRGFPIHPYTINCWNCYHKFI